MYLRLIQDVHIYILYSIYIYISIINKYIYIYIYIYYIYICHVSFRYCDMTFILMLFPMELFSAGGFALEPSARPLHSPKESLAKHERG